MAGEIQQPGTTGLELCAIIRNASGQVWRPAASAFEAYNPANYANYATAAPLTEQGNSGYYVGNFPVGIAIRGDYPIEIRRVIVPATPAESDPVYGIGVIEWSGSGLVEASKDVLRVNEALIAYPAGVDGPGEGVGVAQQDTALEISGLVSTVVGYIDTEITTILSNLATIAGYIDTEVGTIITNLASVASSLATVQGYVDTEVAAILAAVDTEIQTILAAVDTEIGSIQTAANAIKAVTDKLDTALEQDGAVYRYTINALEQAPGGGGGGGTLYGEDGSITFTYTVYETDGTTPLPLCAVYVSADLAGTQRSQTKLTDSLGRVTFDLDPGTVYFWRSHPNFTFTNPDTETVS